jgi:hypothetical protein
LSVQPAWSVGEAERRGAQGACHELSDQAGERRRKAEALKFTKDTLLNKQVRYSRASESVVSLRLATTSDDFSSLAVGKGGCSRRPAPPTPLT